MLKLVLRQTTGESSTRTYSIEVNNKVIGMCQLRLRPSKNDSLPKGFENHIYYEIIPKERGKGYATKVLHLLLKRAIELKLKQVVLVVDEDNLASQKVIEKNGGKLVDQDLLKDKQKKVKKYAIDLK